MQDKQYSAVANNVKVIMKLAGLQAKIKKFVWKFKSIYINNMTKHYNYI